MGELVANLIDRSWNPMTLDHRAQSGKMLVDEARLGPQDIGRRRRDPRYQLRVARGIVRLTSEPSREADDRRRRKPLIRICGEFIGKLVGERSRLGDASEREPVPGDLHGPTKVTRIPIE